MYLCYVKPFLTGKTQDSANIPGYCSYHGCREDRLGGGVSIFVRSEIDVLSNPIVEIYNDYKSIKLGVTHNSKNYTLIELY